VPGPSITSSSIAANTCFSSTRRLFTSNHPDALPSAAAAIMTNGNTLSTTAAQINSQNTVRNSPPFSE
jgi:hypothetical protein